MAQEKSLNKEQMAAIAHGKGPLLVIAGAGTGKTTVIVERILHLVKSGLAKPSEVLALTFTEKASAEMQERVDIAMPYGYTDMWISTFHSFCDRVLRDEALAIGLSSGYSLLTKPETIQFARKNLYHFNLDYFRPVGNPTKFIEGMITHFSRLQDEDIVPSEYLTWVKQEAKKAKSETDKLEIKKWKELADAYQKYEELKANEGYLDFGDLIVKTLLLFRKRPNVLSSYREKFKYILIDEFQDTNYAQFELSLLLAGKNGNVTVVGDDDQCLPPEAVISLPKGTRKIKDVKVGDTVLTAIGRGHLSASKVLHVSKVNKKTRFLTFTTDSGVKIKVTDNHKMFCMIPGKKLDTSNVFYVYLMFRQDMGWRLGITDDLAQRLKLERSADRIIAIKSCASIEEAKLTEIIYSMKYQIPTYPFKPRKQMLLTGEWLGKLFGEFDTVKNARKLAEDLHMDLDAYHYSLDAVVRGDRERIKVVVGMCARKYRAKYSANRILSSPLVCHTVNIETSSGRVRDILESKKIVFSEVKKGIRMRKQFASLVEANEYANKLAKLIGGSVEVRFNLGKIKNRSRSSLIMPASNVLLGMHIPVRNGNEVFYERVVRRDECVEKKNVYDLEIDRTHNFIADNVVVHNSIYRFRGASVSNILQFRDRFPKARTVVLTKNYRTQEPILDASYRLIQHNNPNRLEAKEGVDKKLISQRKGAGEILFFHESRVEKEADRVALQIMKLAKVEKYLWRDFAILVRANSHADSFVAALNHHGIPCQFLGPDKLFLRPEVIELVSYLKVLTDENDTAALYQVLSMNDLAISSSDLSKLTSYAKRKNKSLFDVMKDPSDASVSDETKEILEKINSLISTQRKGIKNISPGRLLYDFLVQMNIMEELIEPDTEARQKQTANIGVLFDKIRAYEAVHAGANAFDVVDWIELASEMGDFPRAAEVDWQEENAVNILTIHAAKGLEFPVVFLTNLVALRFPSVNRRDQIPLPDDILKESIPTGDIHEQEERRLFYVGMTRAKDRLYFTASDFYGEVVSRPKKLSPFIFEALGDDAVSVEQKVSEQLPLKIYEPNEAPVQKQAKHSVHYLSYSQIETFKMCPMHYRLRYVLKVPTAPTGALALGTSVHDSLKEFYERVGKGEKSTEKMLLNILSEKWIDEGYVSREHEEEAMKKAQEMLHKFYLEDGKRASKPLLLEQPFLVPLNKIGEKPLKIGGVIDRVDALPDGSIEIIDYKTGKSPDRGQKDVDQNLQLSLYAIAATRTQEPPLDRTPKQVKLTLWYLDEGVKFSTTRTEEELREEMDKVFEIRKQIESSDFACSGTPLCQNCEYKNFCRQP